MRTILIILLLTCILVCPGAIAQQSKFIHTDGVQFLKDGKPYYFIGTNAWYFMNIASPGAGGARDRLLRELDQLQSLGVDNIRIMAATEGPVEEPYRIHPAVQNKPGKYDENLLKGLDFLLVEMGKRDMKAVLCLNNFFMWSGGLAQYVSWAEGSPIPYPQNNRGTWDEFQAYAAKFYTNEKAQKIFDDYVKMIVTRKNSITGKAYADDPAIMAWQLGNEPRGRQNVVEFVIWADKTAGLIQSLDPNHMVSLGGEGLLPDDGKDTAFKTISQSKNLDYLTMHLWIENWSWYNPKRADTTFAEAFEKSKQYIQEHVAFASDIKKPVVLEEFGVSRDEGAFEADAPAMYRQKFFAYIFEETVKSASQGGALAGCNFWGWAGLGKYERPGDFWKPGEDFTGDPPHELQGWYSIGSDDKELLQLIEENTEELEKVKE